MYRDPARVPLNSSSTGFAQDEHECLFSSDSSIAFPVSTTEQCATVTRLMPFRGWICPVVPSACAGPSGKLLAMTASTRLSAVHRNPFVVEDKPAQPHFGGVGRIVGEYIKVAENPGQVLVELGGHQTRAEGQSNSDELRQQPPPFRRCRSRQEPPACDEGLPVAGHPGRISRLEDPRCVSA